MNFIKNRLRRLEERGRGGPCSECGLPPAGTRRIVILDKGDPKEDFPKHPDECCRACGQPLWTVIEVVYEGSEEGEGPSVAREM